MVAKNRNNKYQVKISHHAKKIRQITAAVFFLLTTFLFLDFTGTAHQWFGWLAKIQLIPAILAANAAVIIVLILLTLLFGRIYSFIRHAVGNNDIQIEILYAGICHSDLHHVRAEWGKRRISDDSGT
jgi:hypothetical protein